MLAILFPCAIIFADDNPLGGLAALAMQASLILWIPAVIWAWKIVHPLEADLSNVAEKPKRAPKKPRSPSAKGIK